MVMLMQIDEPLLEQLRKYHSHSIPGIVDHVMYDNVDGKAARLVYPRL